MATEFTQTNVVSVCGLDAYCSGNGSIVGVGSNQSDVGASAGSNERTISFTSGEAGNAVWMEIINIDDYDGASGDWTTRISITTSNHHIQLNEVHICRINSSCTNQETLGSTTGLTTALGTAQVESVTVTQSSGTTITAGDKIMVVYAFTEGQGMANSIGYTPTQDITGPGTIPSVGGAVLNRFQGMRGGISGGRYGAPFAGGMRL